ncbi:hypothetical protein Golob_011912 [Gossypium lobatum]|uniref:Uncharacterized protein n=1 Tax=Gossypium lobatum TaxID=34289 RepID=A0A7J8MR81_9ROSI|nr:hypothetical protein [Gossypium lobatum]
MHKKLASPFDTKGLACLQALLLGIQLGFLLTIF